jgi:hypothetical protein
VRLPFCTTLPLGLLWFCCTGHAPSPTFSQRYFGFSLNGTLFIYNVVDDKVVDSDPIGEKPFIMQALGVEHSRANPLSENFFARYAIVGCEGVIDTTTGDVRYRCLPLRDLWKLSDGKAGWSENTYTPSLRQQQILAEYRPSRDIHWQGPYYGERAFRLLHDLQDAEWVQNYRSDL